MGLETCSAQKALPGYPAPLTRFERCLNSSSSLLSHFVIFPGWHVLTAHDAPPLTVPAQVSKLTCSARSTVSPLTASTGLPTSVLGCTSCSPGSTLLCRRDSGQLAQCAFTWRHKSHATTSCYFAADAVLSCVTPWCYPDIIKLQDDTITSSEEARNYYIMMELEIWYLIQLL